MSWRFLMPSRSEFLSGGGQAGARIAACDWSKTPLGPIDAWPQSLRTMVAVMLRSPTPMALMWGPQGTLIYNDAHIPINGERGLEIVGQSVREAWPEIADLCDHVMRTCLAGGTLSYREHELVLQRAQGPERLWVNIDHTPVLDETGRPGGVLAVVTDVTRRVLSDQRLRESETRFRTLFEALEVGFCIVELQFDANARAVGFRFTETNAAFKRHRAVEQPIGEWLSEVPLGLSQEWLDTLGQVVLTGEPTRFEDFAAPLDRWFEVHAFRAGAAGQNLVGVLLNDITARRHDEERLRALNADLERQVIERTLARGRTWQLSPDLMGVANAEGIFESSNPAWQRILGWSEAEIASMKLFELIHPEDQARTRAAWEDASQYGLPAIHFENRYRTKDGDWRWLSWVAVPEEGKVYCIARDMTEAKLQADTLAKRTAERDQLWRSSQDLLGIANREGFFISTNPAWQRVLGWSGQELGTTPLLDLVHPDDRERTMRELAHLSAGVSTFRFENRYRHKDGSYRCLSWTARPDGGLYYCVGRDVTSEKEMHAELSMAQEALRQSQKLESIGQLTGGVAHDFNNLLTPIVGVLDRLQRHGVGGAREQRLIGAALQSAERAKLLVQRLLAFARRQPLKIEPVDVGALVQNMADIIASTSGPRIRVDVKVADRLPTCIADRNQLELALLNLAVNARDAMSDGGSLTITVHAESMGAGHRAQLPPGAYVRLSVTDTGIGMDETTAKRAIEPFFSTKGVGQGTGLGLSMVHGLAAQLRGALLITSKPGLGTTVEMWLQASERPAAAPIRAEAPQYGAAKGIALLVDDEELVRASTAAMLAELGYAVVEAASGEEALKLVENGLAVELLVTDQLMPGMTGSELAREVHARRGSSILIISGFSEVDMDAPHVPHLMKPFGQAELAAKLAQFS